MPSADAPRNKTFLLAAPEERALNWLAARLPARVLGHRRHLRSDPLEQHLPLVLAQRLRGLDVEARLDPGRGHVRVLAARPRRAAGADLDFGERDP